MPATKVQLIGGQFQDSEGNKLALGYLVMKLAMDANISGVGNIASGIEITIQLDSNGSVVSSPIQSVWGVDQMLPPNNYYRVTGYTAAGQPAWGPNNQQVIGSGGTFDVGTWIPNQVLSWTPPVQATILEVNDVPNTVQTTLNLEAGTNITLTDEGDGGVTIDAAVSTPLQLQVNGTPNVSQTLLNLEAGTNITLTDEGDGGVTIDASGGASFSGNGSFMFGPGITDLDAIFNDLGADVPVSEAAGVITANQVVVYIFQLTVARTISKVTTVCASSNGGVTATFGIYTFAGAKVLDSGNFTCLSSSGVQTNSITPVTFQPGIYWHAQATTSASAPVFFGTKVSAGGETPSVLSSWVKNATRAATAANPLSAGVLPATLGVLTPFTPTNVNGDGCVCPLYE